MGVEEGAGVPPGAHGGVDDDTRGHRREQRHHLRLHDRLVIEHLAHPQPLDWRNAVGRVAPATRLEAGGGGVFHRASRGAAHGPGVTVPCLCQDRPVVLLLVTVPFSVDCLPVAPPSARPRSGAGPGCRRAPCPRADRRRPSVVHALAQPLLLAVPRSPPTGPDPTAPPGRSPRGRERRPRARRTDAGGPVSPSVPVGRYPLPGRPTPTSGPGCGPGDPCRPLLHLLSLDLELRRCPQGQTPVEVLGQVPTHGKGGAELRRQDHSSLAVERVLVPAEEPIHSCGLPRGSPVLRRAPSMPPTTP